MSYIQSIKRLFSFISETVKIIILAAVIVVPIRYFIFQPFFVQGISMEPNFTTGDYLIIDEITYRFREPQRGEVIVFRYPKNPTQHYIKRIIGLPGETVEIKDGQIIIENQILDESVYLDEVNVSGSIETTLADDQYFVLGDNRDFSSDSRRWGELPEDNIIGKVFLRAWPFVALARIEAPTY